MSAPIAIALVSESIKALLDDAFSALSPATEVTILPPDQANGDARRLNLFLYKIEESTFLKNKDWQVDPSDPTQIVPPPLSLYLNYLLTPYGPNDELLGNAAVQQIMGEAMRALHQNPIMPNEFLSPGLQDAPEQIKISQTHLDLDELSKIWGTFEVPFRLSVAYEISVVQIDQQSDQAMAIPTRVSSINTPLVNAPYTPPKVTQYSPINLSPGGTLSLSGENLNSWFAYVTVSGRRIADGQVITGDSFDITIPPDLALGFHQVQVDISRLHRSTFFVEIV